MDTSNLQHHYSQKFNTELEGVRSRVLAMGGLVEQQLEAERVAKRRSRRSTMASRREPSR